MLSKLGTFDTEARDEMTTKRNKRKRRAERKQQESETKRVKDSGLEKQFQITDSPVKIADVVKTDSKPSFQQELMNRLKGSRFRFLNEDLFYSKRSHQSEELIKQDGQLFLDYHEGFKEQVSKWPANPVRLIEKHLRSKPTQTEVADFGCGEAHLAQSLSDGKYFKKVHSFDLYPFNEHVTVSNSKKTPLHSESMNVVVFSLSLMGNDFWEFLMEASRVLKIGGEVVIAEVKSRFAHGVDEKSTKMSSTPELRMKQGIGSFVLGMKHIGFESFHPKTARSGGPGNQMFVLLHFKKKRSIEKLSTVKKERAKMLKKLKTVFQFKAYKYKKR